MPSLQSYKVNFTFICKHNLWLILLHTFRDTVLLALAKDNVTFKPTVDSPKNSTGRYFWTCLSAFRQELLLGWCNSKGGGSVRVTRIQRERNGRRCESPAYRESVMGDETKHLLSPCQLKCSAGLWANIARFFSGLYCQGVHGNPTDQ